MVDFYARNRFTIGSEFNENSAKNVGFNRNVHLKLEDAKTSKPFITANIASWVDSIRWF